MAAAKGTTAFSVDEIKRAHTLISPILQAIAERIWATAQNATAAYIAAEMPGSVTESETEKDERYHRTVTLENGQRATVVYDHRSTEITVRMHKNERRTARKGKPAAQPKANKVITTLTHVYCTTPTAACQ